jgi:GDP/UDP-N,N'-diacetylbacillosamine 2-epimerase (hydrolysing)
MGNHKTKIGILSSSRADYGIYIPLIVELSKNSNIQLDLIAFGTHLSKFHGYTINNIDRTLFNTVHEIENIIANDSTNSISTSFSLTSLKFSDFWKNSIFDLIFCLGDRYEMAAAVLSAVPYQIKFAHIHGGEETIGAIDNIYRHCITLSSNIHFVSTKKNKQRVIELLKNDTNIVNVGSLSLDNINYIKLLSITEFQEKWGIDLNTKSILITIHPETVNHNANYIYAQEIYDTLLTLSNDYQLIITMPNADTSGFIYREKFKELKTNSENVFLIENFGIQSYFTCMKYSNLLFGNSSSGIIEAASFEKYVINIGDRQKGREASKNIINVPFEKNRILTEIKKYICEKYEDENVYYNGGAVKKIIQFINEKI